MQQCNYACVNFVRNSTRKECFDSKHGSRFKFPESESHSLNLYPKFKSSSLISYPYPVRFCSIYYLCQRGRDRINGGSRAIDKRANILSRIFPWHVDSWDPLSRTTTASYIIFNSNRPTGGCRSPYDSWPRAGSAGEIYADGRAGRKKWDINSSPFRISALLDPSGRIFFNKPAYNVSYPLFSCLSVSQNSEWYAIRRRNKKLMQRVVALSENLNVGTCYALWGTGGWYLLKTKL